MISSLHREKRCTRKTGFEKLSRARAILNSLSITNDVKSIERKKPFYKTPSRVWWHKKNEIIPHGRGVNPGRTK